MEIAIGTTQTMGIDKTIGKIPKSSTAAKNYANKGDKVQVISCWGEGYIVSKNGNRFSVLKTDLKQ